MPYKTYIHYCIKNMTTFAKKWEQSGKIAWRWKVEYDKSRKDFEKMQSRQHSLPQVFSTLPVSSMKTVWSLCCNSKLVHRKPCAQTTPRKQLSRHAIIDAISYNIRHFHYAIRLSLTAIQCLSPPPILLENLPPKPYFPDFAFPLGKHPADKNVPTIFICK